MKGKEMLELLRKLEWSDIFKPLVTLAALALIVLFITFCFAPKNVDYYYLANRSDSRAATCVYAHWTWNADQVAFCTDDKDRALDFVAKANQFAKK